MIRACLLAVSTLLSPELVELQVGRDHCLFLSFFLHWPFQLFHLLLVLCLLFDFRFIS